MAIGYLKGAADQLNAITQKLSRFVWGHEIEMKVNADTE